MLIRNALTEPMMITGIDVTPLNRVLKHSFFIASDRSLSTHIKNLAVRMNSSRNGRPLTGLGEAAPLTGISGDTQESLQREIEGIVPDIVGNAFTVFELESLLKGRLHFSAARAAIEMAFLNLLAHSHRTTLARLLNPHLLKKQTFVTDITIPIVPADEAARMANAFWEEGFERFKIKVGDLLGDSYARVRAVHKTIMEKSKHDSFNILLDANEGYNRAEAISLVETLRSDGIKVAIFEQPVGRRNIEDLRRIRDELSPLGTMVFADESVYTLDDAHSLIDASAVNGINLKLMKHGGIIETFRIAELANQHGISLMIGGMVETDIAMSSSLALAHALGNICWLDLDTPRFIVRDHNEDAPPLIVYHKGQYIRSRA